MHGAFCVKFGCGYAHPPGRIQDCEFGILCTDKACPKIHPRPSKSKKSDVSISEPKVAKFQVGQQVQAQYKVGTTWRLANVIRVHASGLTLQFLGWNDVAEIPFERIRRKPITDNANIPPGFNNIPRGFKNIPPGFKNSPPGFKNSPPGFKNSPPGFKSSPPGFNNTPPGFSTLFSRGAAVATGPSSPRMSYRMRSLSLSPQSATRPAIRKAKFQSEVLNRLDRMKQAAIAKEDFLLANSLKEKMEKVNDLERKKAVAVRTEDFLLAMDIKKQINQLTASTPISQETKQEHEDLNNFSLFENAYTPAITKIN